MMDGIYVEALIKGSMDEVWHKTQTPNLHQCWDLRFSRISYLPRQNETEPQQFLYSTCIGFGLKINGQGETVGNKERDNERVSALKFWSADPKSLIREGSGYWKYIQTSDGIKFLT
jgi:hypothetical protein